MKIFTTHFSDIYPNINVLNISLYLSGNDFNNNFNHSNNLSFIHINICSIPNNLKIIISFI